MIQRASDFYTCSNVFDMRTVENLVTVTRNDVKTNSDCPMSTGVCISKEANRYTIQYIVELAETLIVYLYSQHDVVLLALRWEPQLGNSFRAFLPSAELYLLHWQDLQKGQNSPQKWSRAVTSSCAHHYVLDGSTLPM